MVRSPCVCVSARTTRALKCRSASFTAWSMDSVARRGEVRLTATRDAAPGCWARPSSAPAQSASAIAAITDARTALITVGR